MSSIFWTQPWKIEVGNLISNKPDQVRSWNRNEGQLRNKLHRSVQSQNLEISASHKNIIDPGPLFPFPGPDNLLCNIFKLSSNPLTIFCRISAIKNECGTHQLPILNKFRMWVGDSQYKRWKLLSHIVQKIRTSKCFRISILLKKACRQKSDFVADVPSDQHWIGILTKWQWNCYFLLM